MAALVFCGLALSPVCAADPAGAEPPPGAARQFYQGRSMTMISGYTPDGGDRQQERAFAGMSITSGLAPRGEADLHGRLLARHMGRHIPGRPQFIVRTLPGAGGRRQEPTRMRRSTRPCCGGSGVCAATPGS